MDLSIIIVNWNSKDYLRKCITSILAETAGLDYEIIVIDAASYDGCDAMLERHFPQVRFIQSEVNSGFARANNTAYAASHGDTLLFLNPDTELRGPAINVLYEHAHSLPKAGAVGAKLLNSDGTVQTSCIQAFPTILNQLLNADVLRRRFPKARLWGMAPLFGGNVEPTKVDVVSGACLMIRREAFQHVGLFSSDYFMYSEDVDLCHKTFNAGWINYYIPAAIILHHGGTSSSQHASSTFSSVMTLESRWRFFRKTRSLGYCWAFRLCMLAVSLARCTVSVTLWLLGAPMGRGTQWKVAWRKWKARLQWALGAASVVPKR